MKIFIKNLATYFVLPMFTFAFFSCSQNKKTESAMTESQMYAKSAAFAAPLCPKIPKELTIHG
ncbi:MAG TPA: hypothetical protein PKC40_11340, partial [Saprospiraceae bacterium]|nr:hypothetical protein [Saprospiraceae bacterium]